MKRSSVVLGILPIMLSCTSPQWREYTAPDGSFRVLLPEEPTVRQQREGKLYLTYKGAVGYSVAVDSVPDKYREDTSPDALFDELQADATRALNGILETQRPVQLQSYAGREFVLLNELKTGPMRTTFRVFRAGDRVFALQVITPRDGSAAPESRFWESFVVLDR